MCRIMSCHVPLRYVTSCFILACVLWCHVVSCSVVLRSITLRHAVIYNGVPFSVRKSYMWYRIISYIKVCSMHIKHNTLFSGWWPVKCALSYHLPFSLYGSTSRLRQNDRRFADDISRFSVTSGFPTQRASDAESISVPWRHRVPSGSRPWLRNPGPRLNIKTVLSRYGDSYVKDKTAVRTSYL